MQISNKFLVLLNAWLPFPRLQVYLLQMSFVIFQRFCTVPLAKAVGDF